MRLSYHFSISHFVFGLVFLISAEVRSGDLPDQLELKDSGKKIENKIELQISNAEYSRLKGVDGKRVYLTDPGAEINGEKVAVKGIHTRGKTSLYYRRKSLSFSMDKKITFTHGKRSVSLKKFKAISPVNGQKLHAQQDGF